MYGCMIDSGRMCVGTCERVCVCVDACACPHLPSGTHSVLSVQNQDVVEKAMEEYGAPASELDTWKAMAWTVWKSEKGKATGDAAKKAATRQRSKYARRQTKLGGKLLAQLQVDTFEL